MFDFIIPRNQNALNTIRELRDLKESIQIQSQSALNKFSEQIKYDYIYNSNAIEGNTLSYNETEALLEHGITINGKPVKDYIEVINHSTAYDNLIRLIETDKPITEQNIKYIHRLITIGLLDAECSGKYRRCNVRIGRSKHLPPTHDKVLVLMKELVEWYNKEYYEPEELAVAFKYYFLNIHPFVDGNGRTSRLLYNLIMLKQGYTPIIIENKDRLEYYISLEETNNTHNLEPIMNFMYKYVKESLERYIKFIY